MSETPVSEVPVVEQPKEVETAVQTPLEKTLSSAKKEPGPADDLRRVQALLINGIFPGNAAPEIVKAYKLLESMALQIEKEATSESK